MKKTRAELPRIHWQQLDLFPPTLTQLKITVTAHGPSGSALIGLTVCHGDPATLVAEELYTGVELLDIHDQAIELLRQMICHELDHLSPF